MKSLIYCCFFLLSFTELAFSQREMKINFNGQSRKVVFNTQNNLLHGYFCSYHPNGKKHAEGYFAQQLRTGLWTVWDSTGKVCVKRNYSAPFVYETIYPSAPSSPLVKLLNLPEYIPKRNKDGYFEFFDVKIENIWMEKRLWKFIPVDNHFTVEKNNISNAINEAILADKLQAYTNDLCDSTNAITLEKAKLDSFQIIGFKTFEVYFFDTKRFDSENRIISLGLVGKNLISKDTCDLYWVSYEEIRPLLGAIKMSAAFSSKNIERVEDLFFFNRFQRWIYKIGGTFNNREVSKHLKKETLEQATYEELFSLLEFEHHCWAYFKSKKEHP